MTLTFWRAGGRVRNARPDGDVAGFVRQRVVRELVLREVHLRNEQAASDRSFRVRTALCSDVLAAFALIFSRFGYSHDADSQSSAGIASRLRLQVVGLLMDDHSAPKNRGGTMEAEVRIIHVKFGVAV
jgi:hypothetical protein